MCRLYELTDYWLDEMVSGNKGKPDTDVGKVCPSKREAAFGLAAYAIYPVSTGKLEGFNKKIKVAKRISYDYHNCFFFILIRYLSIQFVRNTSHKNP